MKDITRLKNAIASGHIISFDYKKNDKTPIEKKTIRTGFKLEARMKKQGTPIKGVGNWQTGNGKGKFGGIVERDGKIYVRGIDMKEESNEKAKIYCLDKMSNISYGN